MLYLNTWDLSWNLFVSVENIYQVLNLKGPWTISKVQSHLTGEEMW